MVNVGLGWSSVLGIALAAAGLGLYFLRSFRPKLARDHDIVFAAIALLCGGILFFQGWRQDPILQFGQFLLTGSAVFFAVESVRLRGVATEQARRNTPVVDEERPVSRVYKAELDDFDAFADRSTARRIRGSAGSRSGREDYNDSQRRRPSPSDRSGLDDRYSSSDDSPSRRPRRTDDDYSGSSDYFLEDGDSRSQRGRSGSSYRSGNQSPGSAKSRRPRSDEPSRSSRNVTQVPPSQYVDYRPIENDDETDNWGEG